MAKKKVKPTKKKARKGLHAPMGGQVKHRFKTYTYRGVDVENLVGKSNEELARLFPCRVRRKLQRGLGTGAAKLLKKLRKAVCEKIFIFH